MADHVAFLRAFLAAPQRIGAVAPSSAALAHVMVDGAQIGTDDIVVELGAGTGPVTEALAQRHGDVPLLVLEPDAGLAEVCRERVGVEVLEAYAQDLPALLAERSLGKATRVVSSLPFAGWPAELQDAVFQGVFDACTDDLRFVTFTYAHTQLLPAGRRTRRILQERFCTVETTPIVWGNVPPAYVYVCQGRR